MAYCCYTVQQAEAALDEVRRTLLRNKLELAHLVTCEATKRNLWAIRVQKELIGRLTQRRTFLEEQLRRAKWNEEHFIQPVGPREDV